MSVYKEDIMMLDQLEQGQRQIFEDACDAGYMIAGRSEGHRIKADNDAKAVDALREFINDNLEFGTVTKSTDFVKGGTRGWWKFSKEMVECIEDGHKVGAGVDITLQNDPLCRYISVHLRSPK
jgi:hypothetical protein